MCPVLQNRTELRLCAHKSFVWCPQQKIPREMRENLPLVQSEQGFMKVVAFDLGLERWAEGCRCSREAVLTMRANCGAHSRAAGPADRVELGLQKKELVLMQNVYPKGVCQEQVGKPGSWLQIRAGRRWRCPPVWALRLWWWGHRFFCLWMWSQVSGRLVWEAQADHAGCAPGNQEGVSHCWGKSKIIHFHVRSCWTVAPPLSLTTWTTSLKSGMWKNQIEDAGANETGLFLSFDCYDKPHWIEDVRDFCLEFSFYAQQFRKPSRVNPHHPPCILFLVASQRVPGTE